MKKNKKKNKIKKKVKRIGLYFICSYKERKIESAHDAPKNFKKKCYQKNSLW